MARKGILLEEVANGHFKESELELEILAKPNQQYPLIFDGMFRLYFPIAIDEKEKKDLGKKIEELGTVEFECEKQFLDFIPLKISKSQLRKIFEENGQENGVQYEKTHLFDKYLARSKVYTLVLMANTVGAM